MSQMAENLRILRKFSCVKIKAYTVWPVTLTPAGLDSVDDLQRLGFTAHTVLGTYH